MSMRQYSRQLGCINLGEIKFFVARGPVKTKHRLLQGVPTSFGSDCEEKTWLVGILVIFHDGPMFSHINGKLSPRLFEIYG